MSLDVSAPARRGLAGEIRTTAFLAAPLVAGHVSTGLIGFVDNVLAGHHGTTTLASVTVGTALWWLPMMVPIGTLLSVPPSVSQLDGAGRRGEIGALFRQALWLALGLGVVLFAFLSAIPLLLGPVGIAPEIVPGATAFLHGIRWGVFALTLFFCTRYLSEGLHWTLPTMLLSAGGLLVLGPLGYALTFGRFGFPELGAGGLGYASAAMLWLQAVGFLLVLRRARRFADLGLFARFDPPHWPTIRNLLATGLPIGVTVMMEGGLFIATALLIGRLGEVPAAAHQIAINLASLCFMVPMGLAEATTVRVGHALGRGDFAGVRRAAFAGYAIVLATQAVSGIVLLTGNEALVGLYTRDAAVAALAASLLLYAAAFQFPDGVQVLSAGALRGLKDTRVPMLLAALAYWGIGMPLGAGLGLGLGWGPRGMWIGLIAGLTFASLLLCTRFLRASTPRRLAAARLRGGA
ncbi:MATE family efflux transporter [Vulcaniibacterium tengchongense]|uniref:MATE family multidrug resistance protein n=1 Tax=Vulcaniibacterium tengchongense TaxID=1273429 RepID=A0A3N4VKN7_9GAMM|nr:MATE family efflux transporter [Vulcaniibacterium tengchongense]RPE79841.1 MATE family multidrug resistance protein [Vulcaniibacterium tengchongense]